MIPPDISCRYDELSAGLAMSDLGLDETRELESLAAQYGLAPDSSFELMASALEVDGVIASGEVMPAALSARLHQWADQTQSGPATNVVIPDVPAWQKLVTHPATGWAAAAAVLVFAAVSPRDSKIQTPSPGLTNVRPEIRLRTEARDLIERSFAGIGGFSSAGGKVIWSDEHQEGYMILSGVPANDPKQAQYQLWIVDPTRDADSPVDGGVFDIPADGTDVVIPIAAKLAVKSPQAFVITLEQPGGVVKSKQEKVVALAKG